MIKLEGYDTMEDLQKAIPPNMMASIKSKFPMEYTKCGECSKYFVSINNKPCSMCSRKKVN